MMALNFRLKLLVMLSLSAVALAGCSDSMPSLPKIGDLNPFKEKIAPLPGKRISVMPEKEKVPGELADATQPIALPPERLNDTWSQPGGEANNAPGNLTLSGGIHQTWSADAGAGTSKSGRVSASPIVAEGRIYALDAAGTVSAFSLSGGSPVWRASLEPTVDNSKKVAFNASNLFSLGGTDGGGYGGGLAADGGKIFAASGFGTVIALDPSSGKRIWEKTVGAPVRSSPTAAAERVFVVTTEGRIICLSAVDGTELWSARGLPQQASLTLNASPAVDGDVVVAPFPSGDILALKISDGSSLWTENLARARTTSQLTALSDAARPVIDNGVTFAIGHGGRMVATQVKTGERLWSLNVPGTQAPWVAGDTVFVVDTTGQLMAIARQDGRVRWTAKLPGGTTWSGPTLASGTLYLASNTGQLVGVEAATGRVASQQDIGEPVYVAPIVAQGKMFVLTDKARLIAMN
jgi:outer membrane protein assembly factor BamB